MQLRVFFILFALAVGLHANIACASELKIINIPWEQACGDSNIRVTRVNGRITAIEAFSEHFHEARQWQCHFKDGKIVSALYRHSIVTRKAAGDAGEFTTEWQDDVVSTYHFSNHTVTNMPTELLKDLQSVIAKANE
jgi:hypothetical protein